MPRCIRNPGLLLILAVIFELTAPWTVHARVVPVRSRQILLINSYHHSFAWDEEISSGLNDVLRPRETGIILHEENMDTKRVAYNQRYIQRLRDVYEHKYRNTDLDLILATDNNAFDFLLNYHDALFPGVPVVFGGVNFFQDKQIINRPLFTGVAEGLGAARTVELALKIHPGTKTVYVINDYTLTGQAMTRTIKAQLGRFANRVRIRYADEVDFATLLSTVERLPQDTVVLFCSFNRDSRGRFFTTTEATASVTSHCQAPVYGLYSAELGHGIVGGMLASGYAQGLAMGQVALHILAGRDPREIPVIHAETSNPMFDYNLIKKYGIQMSSLPADSLVINRPQTFYSRNSRFVWLGVGLTIVETIIIMALIINITRRKQAEEELRSAHDELEQRVRDKTSEMRDSEEALRTVFDASHDAIFIHDSRGRILEMNQRMIDMYGLEHMDVEDLSIARDLSSRDNPLYRISAIWRDTVNGDPQSFEWRARRVSDGHEFDAEVHLNRIVFRGQEAILSNVRDISVRKESENRIRQSLTKFEAILDNSLMGIAMSVSRRIVTINRRGAEIFGYTPEEIENNSLDLLLGHYQTEDEFVAAAKASLLERGEFNTEQAFRSKNGSTVWCRMYAKSVDPESLTKGVIWAWDDITDNRRAQEDLLRTREDAEAANRAKSEFLAAMSHEIRTPMNAIVGMTDITLQTDLSEDQRDYLKTVKESAQHLLSIINDILDLSKIEARKLELDRVDFDLPSQVRTTIKGLQVQASQKGLELELEIDPGVECCVKGDPLSLRQVLVNLVGNGVKFTHKGSVIVRVLPPDTPPPGGEDPRTLGVRFEVEDTGIGIPHEFLETIFQSFSQTTRAFGGTGLGLAICKQLIALMGGEIRVKSTVGKGSLFHFTAWFEPGEYCPVAHEDEPGLPERPARPVRVLVAEDNDVNVMVTTLKLDDLGYTYSVASNGLEVLDMLKNESFDLILMDIEMPVMDGIATTKAIRSAPPGGAIPDPSIPIIGVTAHALKEFRDKSLNAGMDFYVSKPVDFVELASAINRILGPAPSPGPETGPETVLGPGPETAAPAPVGDVSHEETGENPWTPDAAMEHLGVDPAVFSDFLGTARTELTVMVEELEQAISSGDLAAVRRLGGTIRSICIAVGANVAAGAARDFLDGCAGDSVPGETFAALREQILRVLKIMAEDNHP